MPVPPDIQLWVYMLRHKPDDNCDGDPVSLHATRESAEAELAKYSDPAWLVVEPWPVMP